MIEIIRRLIVAGVAAGVIAGNSDELARFYNETVVQGQQIATAADLRSICIMLDHEYLKTGRVPEARHFRQWLTEKFRSTSQNQIGLDHWGRLLVYEAGLSRKRYVLISTGPDGLLGTIDDLRAEGP